ATSRRSGCRTDMPRWATLARAWRLDVAGIIAVGAGAAAALWWDAATPVPTVDRAVPIIAILPTVLVLSVGWVLVERWPSAMAPAWRSPELVRLGRYVVVQGVCGSAAAVATIRAGTDCVAVTLVGVALVGVLAPWLRGWYWVPMLLTGYLWLQVSTHVGP